MTNKICIIRENIKNHSPLIHCITNPISINQCANAILSAGAKPIMAEHPYEVEEITASADVLMLNTGNITDARMESMPVSLKKAKERNIPVLLDAVGVACSKLRREYVQNLMSIHTPSVIKGNFSEIAALHNKEYYSSGVDADASLNICSMSDIVKELAIKNKTTIIATGKTDIVSDGIRLVHINNGTADLSDVTGTGCMLGALCSAFMSVLTPVEAAISACVYFGICGETAKTNKGNGSFMVNLMDKISTLSKEEILTRVDMEEK